MKMPTQTSVAQFFNWLRATYPQVYNRVKSSGVPLAALDLSSILDNVKDVATAYLTYDTQKDLMAIQIERARAGLSPLDTSQYSPSINAGLTSSTQGAITTWLLIGGAVLVGVMLLRR